MSASGNSIGKRAEADEVLVAGSLSGGRGDLVVEAAVTSASMKVDEFRL